MKKIFSLLAVVLIAFLAFGVKSANAQNDPIFAEDFSAVTGSGTQQCEAGGTAFNSTTLGEVLPGWSGDKVYPANGKVKLGTGSVNGELQTPAIDLSSYGSIRIVFQARSWNGNDATTMTVYVNSTAYTVEGLPNTGTSSDVQCDLETFEIMASGGGATTIRFVAYPRAFIDNVAIYAATEPTISVMGNTTFNNVSVGQACNTTLVAKGFNLLPGSTTVALTGDSQFTTTTTTSIVNDLLMDEAGVNIPVAFSANAAGDYSATLSFSNSDLAEPITVELTAHVISVNDIPAIDQLRALIDNSDVTANVTDTVFYKYTGHAYITQVFQEGSFTKWMQDSTGAIQIYDPDGLLANVTYGQEITNVVGLLSNYYGYTEFNVQAGISNSDINAFPSSVVEPIVVTLAQLQNQDYMDGIQAELIKLEGVTFEATGNFANKTRYVVSQNGVTDTAVYINSTYDTYYNFPIPTGTVDVIGVNVRSSAYRTPTSTGNDRVASRYYICPRGDGWSTGDDGWLTSIAENVMVEVKVFPNPTSSDVTIAIDAPATQVAIYNMMGELVDRQAMNTGVSTVKMSHLMSGVYFLRIFNDDQLVGTSKVVRQ